MPSSFSSQLKQFSKRLDSIAATERLTVPELFTPEFMAAHTDAPDIGSFLESAGCKTTEEAAEVLRTPTDAFQQHVAAHSHFSNWEEMLRAAGSEWMKRQLEGR